MNDDEFRLELLATFLDEASDLLADAEKSFLVLETTPSFEIIDNLFRLAHNLKGSSRAVGLDDVGNFTHKLESFLLKIKNKEIPINSSVVDLLLASNDYLTVHIDKLKAHETPPSADELMQRIINFQIEPTTESTPPEVHASKDSTSSNDTTSVDTTNLVTDSESINTETETINTSHIESDVTINTAEISALNQATEPYTLTQDHTTTEEKPIQNTTVSVPEKESSLAASTPEREKPPKKLERSSATGTSIAQDGSIRVSLSRLEKLINYLGELVILQTSLAQQKHMLPTQFLQKTVTQLTKITKDVQNVSTSLRMVSMNQLFQKMQRIVRDVSKSLGKETLFVTKGEDTELDKSVVDLLGDPLVHLVRNAVDHGLESNEERARIGKSMVGMVTLSAMHQAGKIVIEVSDDGGGLDPQKLREKAIKKGLISATREYSDDDLRQIIFHPGFSTKEVTTDISGRGVGLDVVKTNIEKILQGEVQIESEVGKGSVFRFILPLTLAIIDGLVVRVGSERYVVPLGSVHESLLPKSEDIHTTSNAGEILLLRGETMPLFSARKLLGVKNAETKKEIETSIIVRNGMNPFSVGVDEIIGQQQVVIKKLGTEVQFAPGIIGGTVLGDGCASLILDFSELVKQKLMT